MAAASTGGTAPPRQAALIHPVSAASAGSRERAEWVILSISADEAAYI